jgi:hypothetical protein
MEAAHYIQRLNDHYKVFEALLSNMDPSEYRFKGKPDDWCILEIVCHLFDEEREDFRIRVSSILEDPSKPLPPADPVNWAKTRNYLDQDFETKVSDFLSERQYSVEWLEALQQPNWANTYQHPKVGPVPASLILSNWVVHDLLHIKQITRRKYEFLEKHSDDPIDYAGKWV